MQPARRLFETFKPSNYSLALDLSHASKRTFSGQLEIHGTSEIDGELSLHAKDLHIINAWIDTAEAEISHGINDEITLRSPAITTGSVRVTIDFTGTITDAMHGLYPCYYELDGEKKELFATQFESHHAREVFPCVDEPEAKATFDLQLITTPDLTVLANTPKEVGHQNQNGMIEHIFETTPRMSTYLLAFVVGDLQSVTTQTKGGTDISVWSTRAQPIESLEWGLEITVKTIEFYEDFYGVAFPLAKCDHVALPDFSAGAMENWGLITYREVCLLAPVSSPIAHKQYVATVIAHELAHQWFGNLVTMKWWDDLWLNESFANVMEYIALDHLYPQWRLWETFATDETPLALERDRFKDIQPVAYEINHPDEIGAAFDKAIVYAKGSRLIRMAIAYAGETAFKEGLKKYFETYQYDNAVGADLWSVIGEAAKKDIASFMSKWLTQSGYPLVSVSHDDHQAVISQRRFVVGKQTDDQLWPIPIHGDVFDRDSSQIETTGCLNTAGLSHFVTLYDDASFRQLAERELTAPEQLDLLYSSLLLAEGADAPVERVFEILGAIRHTSSDALWSGASHTLAKLAPFHEADSTAFNSYVQWLTQPRYAALGTRRHEDEPESDTKLRAIILSLLASSGEQRLTEQALHDITADPSLGSLEGDTRLAYMKAVIISGDEEIQKTLLALHDTTYDAALRDDIARALSTSSDQMLLSHLVARLNDSSLVKPQDLPKWFGYLMKNPASRDLAWKWLQDNWKYVENHFAGDMSLDKFPQYAAQFMHGAVALEDYRNFFTPLVSPATERSIRIGIDMIESRTKWLERDLDTVKHMLLTCYDGER